MKKVTFSIGDRVAMIENNELKRGTIHRVFTETNPPLLIVEFNDSDNNREYKKVSLDKVIIESETEEKTEARESSKSSETMKSEITITPDEFRNISVKTAIEFGKNIDNPIGGLIATVYAADLAKKLFRVESDDND